MFEDEDDKVNRVFEVVSFLKTKDGKLFNSEKDAEAHVVDCISEEINEWIKKLDTYDLKHRDLVKIITELCGSIKNIERLRSLLNQYC